MGRADKLLRLILRLVGGVCLLATVAVFMPLRWMAAIHEWVGLGPFPEGAIVEYLARSLSMFYAFFGGLLLLVATDVRRYAAAITYVAIAGIMFSLIILAVDLSIGMPLHWTLQEGPVVLLLSVCILVLQSRRRHANK